MEAGSGPIFFSYGKSAAFALLPITEGSRLTSEASSFMVIFFQSLEVTMRIESVIACPERLVPAALKTTGKFQAFACLNIRLTSSALSAMITIFGTNL